MSTAAVWQGSDAELLTELAALETRLHATWAEMLPVIAEVDSRGTAATVGYTNTIDLVRAVGRVSHGEARARIAAAADVLPTRGVGSAPVAPRLPATAAAVAEHAIGAAAPRSRRTGPAAVAMRRHDHPPGDAVGHPSPELAAHDVQASVDTGGGARTGDDGAVLDVEPVGFEREMGNRDASRPASCQWQVARRWSSSPAAASRNAPEHTLSNHAPRSTTRSYLSMPQWRRSIR